MKLSEKHKKLLDLNTNIERYFNEEKISISSFDMCGAFCNNDKFSRLLEKPTMSHACIIITGIIEYKLFNSELEAKVEINYLNDKKCRELLLYFYKEFIEFDNIDYYEFENEDR